MRDLWRRRAGSLLMAGFLAAVVAAPADAQQPWVDPPGKEVAPAESVQPRRSPSSSVRSDRPARTRAVAAAPAVQPIRRAVVQAPHAARRVRVVTARPMVSRSVAPGRRGWHEVPPGGEVVLLARPPLSGHLVTRRVVWQDETGIRSRTYRVLVDDALW
ncbi:hypothetical protein [Methylobacterium oryzihabitans]|uniref:Uncharacterized protein n=1 Tax=Methylobacterium oryzihabitans TaxID=2499852 RepID=A0A437P280_9HYPH|nr:hypothetical protein [Methylobacterium oryzihabitans]RVU16397.1 hypothetical protein EOE48_17060 [Methylobacterium oryzihabitans]